MKYLVMILVLVLVGCNTIEPITTECKDVVLAQENACLREYPRKDIEIVTLVNKWGTKFHKQVRVRIDNKWYYLKNGWTTYHFWENPEEGWKIILINNEGE